MFDDLFKLIRTKFVNGQFLCNIEDTAKVLGYTRTIVGREIVDWSELRANSTSESVFLPDGSGGKSRAEKHGFREYILEGDFWMYILKGNSEIALAVQDVVFNEILPFVDNYGYYFSE
jgi:prophage antirepressor-like protein